MASRNEDRKRESVFTGYEPTRPARLRGSGAEPPPLPPPASEGSDGFGTADEDGLRMLAALETLTSLEPDYSDELAAEASVTIIESAGHDIVAEALGAETSSRPLRALLHGDDQVPELLLNGYETFTGPGDEATVEIVEATHDFAAFEQSAEPQAAQPASLAERIAAVTGRGAGSRFFKALSGG
ncbi:MAG: hypothetical protein M5U16_13140 [Hyphomicrobium sp.]|nr:hypothetical protein [Hyphomicrobium sp.]